MMTWIFAGVIVVAVAVLNWWLFFFSPTSSKASRGRKGSGTDHAHQVDRQSGAGIVARQVSVPDSATRPQLNRDVDGATDNAPSPRIDEGIGHHVASDPWRTPSATQSVTKTTSAPRSWWTAVKGPLTGAWDTGEPSAENGSQRGSTGRAGSALGQQGQHSTFDQPQKLKTIALWGNWKTRHPAPLPRYLIENASPRLEELVAAFLAQLNKRGVYSKNQFRVGEAWGGGSIQGVRRQIRIVRRLGPGHLVSTDVTLQSQGKDLFVSVSARGFSIASAIRWIFLIFFLPSLLCAVLAFVITNKGVHEGWAQDYARKYQPQLQVRVGTDDGGKVDSLDGATVLKEHILHGGGLFTELGDWRADFREAEKQQLALEKQRMGGILGGGFDGMMVNLIQTHLIFLFYQDCANFAKRVNAFRGISVIQQRTEAALREVFASNPSAEKYFINPPPDQGNSKELGFVVDHRLQQAGSFADEIDVWVTIRKPVVEATKEPWTKWELFKADPKLFMMSVAGIPSIASVFSWSIVGLLFRVRVWMRVLSPVTRWPLPEVMDDQFEGLAGEVLSDMKEAHKQIGVGQWIDLGRAH